MVDSYEASEPGALLGARIWQAADSGSQEAARGGAGLLA